MQREWRFYLDDMIGFAEKVIACTAGDANNGRPLYLWELNPET
jgi:hypothetical protein